MNPGGRGESFELPPSVYAPLIMGVPFTIFIALGIAVLLYFLLAKTKLGYEIRAYGHSPAAARYAGIGTFRMSVLVFVLGGAVAGLAGYHYFAAVPGVYKIATELRVFRRPGFLRDYMRVDFPRQSSGSDSGGAALRGIVDRRPICTRETPHRVRRGLRPARSPDDYAGGIPILLPLQNHMGQEGEDSRCGSSSLEVWKPQRYSPWPH